MFHSSTTKLVLIAYDQLHFSSTNGLLLSTALMLGLIFSLGLFFPSAGLFLLKN